MNLFSKYPVFFKIMLVSVAVIVFIPRVQNRLGQARTTDENEFKNRNNRVVITSIERGGASDRAGLEVGDTILSINGSTFNGVLQADSILRAAEPGQNIDYVVTQHGRTRTAKVQVVRLSIGLPFIVQALVGLSMMVLALFVGFSRPENKHARLLAFGLAVLAPFFLLTVAPELNGRVSYSLAFGLPMVMHAMLYFPHASAALFRQRKLITYAYIGGALTVVAQAAMPLLIGDRSGSQLNQWWAASSVAYTVFITICSLLIQRKHDKDVADAQKWIGVGYGFFGTGVGLVFGLQYVLREQSLFFAALFFAVPASYLYSIIKHRAFGISRVIRRSFSYSVINSLMIAAGVFVFLNVLALAVQLDYGEPVGVRFTPVSIEFFTAKENTSVARDGERLIFLVIGAMLFMIARIIKKYLQQQLDKRFDRQGYDYKTALSELSGVLAQTLTTESLAENIATDVRKFMRLKGIAIFLRDDDDGYKQVAATGCCVTLARISSRELFNRTSELVSPLPASDVGMDAEMDKADVQFIVPMLLNLRPVGILLLGEKLSEEIYKKPDLDFIESLARQAAIAFENARLNEDARQKRQLKRELEFASQVQRELLPQQMPVVAGLDVASLYNSAGDVGGDYYDFILPPAKKIETAKNGSSETALVKKNGSGGMNASNGLDGGKELPSQVTVLVGDVSGKGISAAMYMSRVQGVIRSLTKEELISPKSLLEKTNAIVFSSGAREVYVTLICGRFDAASKTLTLARAGHLPLLWYQAAKKSLRLVRPQGMGIGLDKGERFNAAMQESLLHYGDGDIFIFLSDGVTEAMSISREEFGMARLETLVADGAMLTAKELLQKIENEIIDFVGNAEQHDDITLLVVKAEPVAVQTSVKDESLRTGAKSIPLEPTPARVKENV